MIHKKISGCIFLLIISTSLFAFNSEPEEAWSVLSRARMEFENGQPGEAMNLCEKARLIRRERIISMRSELTAALASFEVRKAGDSITEIRLILEKRNEDSALDVLDEINRMNPSLKVGNSISALLTWLDRRMSYPEADYLLGQIYETEGESSLAMQYYRKVLELEDILLIPNERFTVLYRMAELSELIGDYDSAEMYLLRIVSEDVIFTRGAGPGTLLSAVLRTLRTEKSLEKFFLLYRHDYYRGFEAYRRLATQYYNLNETGVKVLSVSSIAVLVAVTRLSHACEENDFEWKYSSISELFKRVGNIPELKDWAAKNSVWDFFLLYAEILRDEGLSTQANYLFDVLYRFSPDIRISAAAKTFLP